MAQDDSTYQKANERACSQDACLECERLREKLKWCIGELFKWHDFCLEHNINPYSEPHHNAQRILGAFLSSPTLSIRQIQQALHHLGLALASLDSPINMPYAATAVLVILKTLVPSTYRRFIQANMTDKEVLDNLFGLPGHQIIKSTTDGALFEALLAIGYCEFVTTQGKDLVLETESLFHHYCNIIDSLPNFPTNDSAFDELHAPPSPHERIVLGHLASYYSLLRSVRLRRPVGFNLTAQRLELFSDDLVGNNS